MPGMYTITVHKDWLAEGGTPWGNTHEAYSAEELPIEDTSLEDLAMAVVAAERAIHVNQVFFNRVVISTWSPDGDPYAPETFRSIPISEYGLREVGTTHRIDLNGVLKVRRQTTYGRNGKVSYRGVLHEGDVTASASGFWQLEGTSTVAVGGSAWASFNTAMAPYYAGGLASLYLAVIGVTGGDTPTIEPRGITTYTPYGAGFNRMNHKFFNKGT